MRALAFALALLVAAPALADSNLPPAVMVQIAANGDGAVTFDLCEAS